MAKILNNTIFIFLLVSLTSLLAFLPSFQLALFGDDWLVFYRYLKDLGPGSSGPYNNFTFLFTPYGSFDVLMGFLRNIYGYTSTPYYITSYIFRLIAASSFYPFIYYMTKNKYAGIFAVMFFSITPVGLDTTNWVFNMPSYLTIALFNLFLFFLFISREQGKDKLILIAGLLYYLAYVTVPIRMHGSLPFVILIELIWLFKNRNINMIKKILFRVSLFIIIFLFIRFTGHSMGPSEETTYRLNLGLTTSLDLLKQGRFDFIFHPFITFGSLLLPDVILYSRQVSSTRDLLINILLPASLVSLTIIKILSKSCNLSAQYFWRKAFIFSALWTLLLVLIYKGNINTLSSSSYLLTYTAGYSIFVITLLIIHYGKLNHISDSLFLGLIWSFLSFFFAWWWIPTSLYTTTYRYMIIPAGGITIILATILSIILKQKNKVLAICLYAIILFIHFFSTRLYLNYLVQIRGQEVSNKIWSQLHNLPKMSFDNTPSLFYFEGDGNNENTIHDVITFGFPPHMGLLYNIKLEGSLPTALDSLKELSEAVSSGKNLPRFGYPPKPIPIDHIYAFRLEGKDTLINITDAVRSTLSKSK